MSAASQNTKFLQLRKEFPLFIFESFSLEFQKDFLQISFLFCLGEEYTFRPAHKIHFRNQSPDQLPEALLHNLVFHIGMVELVSYWKASCSPNVLVKPYLLNPGQQKWWKKLYFNGLGEFFYLNGITARENDFLTFHFEEGAQELSGPFSLKLKDEIIIPVGGGKDSVVTLSLLQTVMEKPMGMVINQREATRKCLEVAGLKESVFEVERSIDPVLLDLNKKGFLNGHTPFSSLLAFVSALAAAITGKKHIALSNEASANEATIPGTGINHQYSKSFEFEQDFRWYLHKYISPDINYFSFLRPLNELQIAALFSANPAYFKGFKSCNVGSKTDTWCCGCSKCLFTFIMLSPFIKHETLVSIFGENLWEKQSLKGYLEQLAGISPEKPFECVGTIDEVRSALDHMVGKYNSDNMPLLLKHYGKLINQESAGPLSAQLKYWNSSHALDKRLEYIIKGAIKDLKALT